jgi:hypothetical protein
MRVHACADSDESCRYKNPTWIGVIGITGLSTVVPVLKAGVR